MNTSNIRLMTNWRTCALTLFDALAMGRNQSAPMLRQGEVKRNKGETAREIMHAPCRLAFSSIIIQRSAEDVAPPAIVAWATSAGNHQFQIVDVKRQLLRLTEGSKQKSTIPLYYIKMKCQRMVGQCPACPIGRAVAVPMFHWSSSSP